MTTPIVTPENNRTRAHAAQERYRSAAGTRSASLWAKLRPWLIGAAVGLLVGLTLAFGVVDRAAPLAGAVQVRNAMVTVENDGSSAFLVSGWIVPLPKAPGQP